MSVHIIFAALLVMGIALPGCALPRGPLNIGPIVPRWLSHGELSGDCPTDQAPHDGATAVDPSAVRPPVSKFHPVPTRPVFEPDGVASALGPEL